MGILFGFKSSSTEGVVAATWTEANIGDDVTGSRAEISATAVTLTAAGTSDSTDDGTLAYQTISAAQDIQIIAKVPAVWTGTLENFTFFGVSIRDENLNGDPARFNCLVPETDGITRAKYELTVGSGYTTHANGKSTILRPKWVAITYDHSAGEIKFWESADGVANNYEQIGSTVTKTLTFPAYACLYGTSHNNSVTATAALTECSVSSTISISQAAPPAARNIRGVADWETGQIQDDDYAVNGVPTDGMRLQIMVDDGSPFTITNITKANPAVVSYSGASLSTLDAVRLEGISGMTELEGKMVRARNIGGGTFDAYWDGNEDGYNPTQALGNNAVNSSGYGTFSGSCTGQLFKAIHTGSGNPTVPTDADTRVISSANPPTNEIGSADPVGPLIGSNFLMSEIYYWKDYALPNDAISNPLGNSDKNKPRVSYSFSGSKSKFNWQNEEWFSFSIFLPSNYDHEETLTGVTSRNQIYYCDDEGAGDIPCEIHLRGNGAGTDRWELDGVPVGSGIILDSTDEDVGKWTTFVIQIKPHPTDGILKIWKSQGAYTTGLERADDLVANFTNRRIGPISGGTTFRHNLRQYKGSWHNNNNTINSTVIFLGFDEIRYGGVNEGTGFSDVHPFQHSEP